MCRADACCWITRFCTISVLALLKLTTPTYGDLNHLVSASHMRGAFDSRSVVFSISANLS